MSISTVNIQLMTLMLQLIYSRRGYCYSRIDEGIEKRRRGGERRGVFFVWEVVWRRSEVRERERAC